MRSVHFLAGLALVASPLLAQTAPAPVAVPVVTQTVLAPVTRDVVLPEGTDFSVVTVDEMSSKTANKDDVVPIRTDQQITSRLRSKSLYHVTRGDV